jgi:hypothetical protein
MFNFLINYLLSKVDIKFCKLKKIWHSKNAKKIVNKHKHIFIKYFDWSQSWAPLQNKALN